MKRTLIIILVTALILVAGVNIVFAKDVMPNAISTSPPTGGGELPTATSSFVPQSTTDLKLDNLNMYEHMYSSYNQGYLPAVEGGVAYIRLPLLPEKWAPSPEENNMNVVVKLDLGGESSPFIIRNYDTSFTYATQQVKNIHGESTTQNAWLLIFDLALKSDRTMGTYPLNMNVTYLKDGIQETQNFAVNVTVDGIDPKATPTPTSVVEKPNGAGSAPKVIIGNYAISPKIAYAGEVFDVSVTLKNTSTKESVKNIVVTYKSQTTDLLPESNTNSFYIDKIDKDSTSSFNFKMKARSDAKPGPQKVDISVAYEDGKAAPLTAADEITVLVRQKIRLEFDEPKFPMEVMVGDSIPTTLNIYNKGKNILYNVTVVLDLPGFMPDASAFLGNMDSGVAKTADIYANITGEVMGETKGQFLITYEDEYGDSYELKVPLTSNIMEMVVPEEFPGGDISMEPEQSAGIPWWAYLIIAGGAVVVVIVVIRVVKKKKRHRELEGEIEDDELY